MPRVKVAGARWAENSLDIPFLYTPIQETSGTSLACYGNVGVSSLLLNNATGKCWGGAPPWLASCDYLAGEKVESTTRTTGKRWICTVAGTSGATEPTWDTTIGNPTDSGGARFVCQAIPGTEAIISGSGMDEDLDWAHPNSVAADTKGHPLFDLLDCFRGADRGTGGGITLLRARAVIPSYYDTSANYYNTGSIISFGATSSVGYALTLNNSQGPTNARYGMDLVTNRYCPSIDGVATCIQHIDFTGRNVPFDNGEHDLMLVIDAQNARVLGFVDGAYYENSLNEDIEVDFVLVCVGDTGLATNREIILRCMSDDGRVAPASLTLFNKNSATVPGDRAPTVSSSGTTCYSNEIFVAGLRKQLYSIDTLEQVAKAFATSPRGHLPGALSLL